jgi:hypothetical protein
MVRFPFCNMLACINFDPKVTETGGYIQYVITSDCTDARPKGCYYAGRGGK